MKIVPYQPFHMACMKVQKAQASTYLAPPEQHCGESITGMIGDRPIFCAGRIAQWEGRYILWAVLSEDARKHMLAVTRELMFFIELCKGRLEIIVDSKFEAAHRWAKLLGFRLHHHEEMFLPDGGDADIYVRFQ